MPLELRHGGQSLATIPASVASGVPRELVPYVQMAGGQEVVVPNGVYLGGSVNTAHPGWLVLKAETPGGVVVDLGGKQLKLNDGTTKVVFAGFSFVNGCVQLAGAEDIHFWYCDHTYPPDVWKAQYLAYGGVYPANRTARDTTYAGMVSNVPTTMRIRKGLVSPFPRCKRIGSYGCDFHVIGDDAIIMGVADYVKIIGTRIWDVSEKDNAGVSVDPGNSYGSSQDWFHYDGIQNTGNVHFAEIADSWIGQKVQWSADGSNDIDDCTFRRVWIAGSATFGIFVNAAKSTGGYVRRNMMDTIRAFGNGQINGDAYNKFRIDMIDSVTKAISPAQYHEAGVFECPATNVTTTVPPGVTVAANGRTLTNITQVRDHVLNPANPWRIANPYATYATYLGI